MTLHNKLFLKFQSINNFRSLSSKSPDTPNPNTVPCIDRDDEHTLPLPEYQYKENESLDTQKARLVYQSRKRGMLENDILLSTFVSKFLNEMTPEQVTKYDHLINNVTNDWDIYYWATNLKPTPEEYDNDIMDMLKRHVKNDLKEKRLMQPNLN